MIVTLNSDYLTEANVFDFFIQVKESAIRWLKNI